MSEIAVYEKEPHPLPMSDDWTTWDAQQMRVAVEYLRRKHGDR